MPLFPPVTPLRAWPCNYPGLTAKPPRDCPDCSLGFWAQGAAWLHFLRVQKAPATVSSYRSSLRSVAAELEKLGLSADRDLRADAITYALAQMAADVGPARFNVARMALKGYLLSRNDPKAGPRLDVARVFRDIRKRPTTDDPQEFEPKEVWRRISAIKTRPTKGFPLALRDAAFIALLFGTGMRPGEAALLTETSINYKKKTVSVPRFKGNSGADVAALPQVLPLVRLWQSNTARKKDPRYQQTANLFHGPEGGRVGRNDWQAMLTRHGLRTGWKSGHGKQFSLRSLRPTFAAWMLNSPAGDIGRVQRQLRHKSPETTARYYARYDIRKLHEVVGKMKL